MREHGALNVQGTDDIPAADSSGVGGRTSHPREDGGTDAAPGTPTVRLGQAVYSLDNQAIGTVTDVSGDYFTVSQGPLQADLFVPYEDLHEMRENVVLVNAMHNELGVRNWQQRPLHPEHRGQGPTRP